MGPNTNDESLMRKLVQNGMDIARFNFSHGDHEEQKGRMDMLKKIREEENKPIAILLDTKVQMVELHSTTTTTQPMNLN